jgi:hypothetical protein
VLCCGHCTNIDVSACSTILFLHFGVSPAARDLIPPEQQSGAVPESTDFGAAVISNYSDSNIAVKTS